MSRGVAIEALEPRRLLSGQMLADVNPVPLWDLLVVHAEVNGHLLYGGRTGNDTYVLYSTPDLSAAPIRLPNSRDLYQSSDDFAFFRGGDGILRTDGTAAGTRSVRLLNLPAPDNQLSVLEGAGTVIIGDELYFIGTSNNVQQIWKTDATLAGTVPVAQIGGSRMFAAHDQIYFISNAVGFGRELHRLNPADGTVTRLTDINEGTAHSFASSGDIPYAVTDDHLYVQATGTNGGVYRVSSDGQVSAIAPGLVAHRMVAAGSRMYLAQSSTYQLRMIDDSHPSMTLVSTPNATTTLLSANAMLPVGDGLITPLRPAGTSNHYPYRTTPDGLTLEPLNLNAPRLTEAPLVIAGDDLVYNGRYGTSGRQLARISLSTGDAGWAIDPETVPYSHLPKVFGSFDGAALFEGTMDAQTSTGAHFFWRPGDVQPTILKTLDIPTRSSAPADFTAYNQSVYFSAIFGSNVRRLMRYDRLTEQVSRVDLQHGVGIDPRNFRVVGDHLFFTGRSGSGWALYRLEDDVPLPLLELPAQFSTNPNHYFEQDGKLRFLHSRTLYESDGTAAGTQAIVEFPAGEIDEIVPFGSGYLFSGVATHFGREPWYSDGTAEGTYMLGDLAPGSGSSMPRDLHVVGDRAYFRGGSTSGQPLWVTDGTPAGTQPFTPFEIGTVTQFTVSNGRLFYMTEGNPRRVWSTAGSHAEAEIVFEIEWPRTISGLFPYHGGAIFRLDTYFNDPILIPGEVFRTDGTAAGTVSILTGNIGGGVHYEVVHAAGATYHVSQTGQYLNVLMTDGTPERTTLIANFTPSHNFSLGFYSYLGVDEDGNVYHPGTSALHGIEPFVTPDLVPPQLRPSSSTFNPGSGTFEFCASETVGSFDLSRIELRGLGSNAIIPVVASIQGAKLNVRPADASLMSLPSDAYRLTVAPGALRDPAGNASQTGASHEVTYQRGDLNFDGRVNNLDIAPFVMALVSPQLFELAFDYSPRFLGDVNHDGAVNNLDIAPFVALLTGSRAESMRPVRGVLAPAPIPVRASLFTDEPLLGSGRAAAVLPA